MEEKGPSNEAKIKTLKEFHSLLLDHFEGRYGDGKKFDHLEDQQAMYQAVQRHRSGINRKLEVAKHLVHDVGVSTTILLHKAPITGGGIMKLDALDSMFTDLPMHSVLVEAMDAVDRAIGAYEAMALGMIDLRVGGKETVDIENGIERSLRPAFRNRTPSSEKDITDVVETILNSIGVDFTREKDNVVVGTRAFCPDFSMDSLGLAIEVKFTRGTFGSSALQEQMAADIAAYPLRWKRVLFVIYDMGVIDDPDRLRRENLKHFGVSVIVIKH